MNYYNFKIASCLKIETVKIYTYDTCSLHVVLVSFPSTEIEISGDSTLALAVQV